MPMPQSILRRPGLLSFAVLALAGPAHGQTRDSEIATAPLTYAPSWTGFYVGGGVGVAALNNRTVNSGGGVVTTLDGAGGSGVLASVYGGVDYQVLPKAVIGVLVEGAYSGVQTSATAQLPGAAASISTQPDWGFSALVRAGFLANPNTLLYFLGGYSGQNFHTWGNANVGGLSASFTRDDFFNGFTFGTGLETRLSGAWTTKLEYRYTQFESRNLGNSGLSFSPNLHTVRAGLTYRFGDTAAAQQDTPTTEAPYEWTGIYVGAAGGASSTVTRFNAAIGPANAGMINSGQSLLGGAFGGYDWQWGDNAVVGFLGELDWMGAQSTASMNSSIGGVSLTSRMNMTWSALGRVGFLPTRSTMLYAVAGYTGAFVSTWGSASAAGAGASFQRDDYFNGWTVGPGIETVVFGGWTTRLEYRYSQFEERSLAAGTSVQPADHTIRAGLSYKFGPAAGK
jgi:outer membrane immunogenic protein